MEKIKPISQLVVKSYLRAALLLLEPLEETGLVEDVAAGGGCQVVRGRQKLPARYRWTDVHDRVLQLV